MRHYGLPQKIVGLISVLYKSFECSVLMDSTQTDYFPVKSGVRQGCILSPILFNITLDYIMRQTTQSARHGIQWTMFSQLEDLDYADDIALLSTNARHLQRKAKCKGSNDLSLHEVELSGNNRCQQIEINTYPDSPLFISTGFLPRVSSKRLN